MRNIPRTHSYAIRRHAVLFPSIFALLALSLLTVSPILAAGFAGKWTGTMRDASGGNPMPCVMTIQVQDTLVKGWVGDGGPHMYPIKSGSINGANILIHVDMPGAAYDFTLTLDGDKLSGSAVLTNPAGGTPPVKGTVQLKRAP